MNGSLVADLGIGPGVWLIGTLLLSVTLFFKFSRFWSVRNLDLLLIFALAPGMMMLVGDRAGAPWWPFVWLFVGSGLWLIRCLLDLGLTRSPLLEPNLNFSGLACLAVGVIGLFVAETISLPIGEGSNRNPADSKSDQVPERPPGEDVVDEVLQHSPIVGSIGPRREAPGDPQTGPRLPGAARPGRGPDRRRLEALRPADRRVSRARRATCCCPTPGSRSWTAGS